MIASATTESSEKILPARLRTRDVASSRNHIEHQCGHAFFNERKREAHAKTLAEADSFLVDLGWIKK